MHDKSLYIKHKTAFFPYFNILGFYDFLQT